MSTLINDEEIIADGNINEECVVREAILTGLCLVVSAIFYLTSLTSILVTLCYCVVIISGCYCGLKLGCLFSSSYKPKIKPPVVQNVNQQQKQNASEHQVVFTKNIDDAIIELMDLTIRDCILYWYQDLVTDSRSLSPILKSDSWIILQSVKSRLECIDKVKFLTENVTNLVCQHFNKLHLALTGKQKTFELKPFLSTKAREIKHLQKISEYLLVILLPHNYGKSLLLRHLFREILTHSVLYPTIDMFCDPDYINQNLMSYLDYQAQILEEHNRTYAYAASYEHFIVMISKCSTIEDLKQMRYKIMSEIMHATTINNLKKAKGMAADKEYNPQGTGKADLLEARHLPRYINQLTFGKAQCEKRIKSLGGPDYSSNLDRVHTEEAEKVQNIPGKKILSLSVILNSPHATPYLMQFLKQKDCHALLRFWCEVNEMKGAERSKLYSLGSEIFQNYINNQNSIIRLSKNIVKGMEAFLIADKGPDSFFEAQYDVYVQLEQKWYPAFIVSDIYHKMITDAQISSIDFLSEPTPAGMIDSVDGLNALNSNTLFSDHSSFAKSKLNQIRDKLTDKMNASQAISKNLRTDQKVIEKMQHEIEFLQKDAKGLDLHIQRTEVWSENLGFWSATIHTVHEILEEERLVPYFITVVHLKSDEPDIRPEVFQPNKWLVSRKMEDFHSLYSKLLPAAMWLKNFHLPSQNKWFKNLSGPSQLQRSRSLLQAFLTRIMEDDQLNKSEALYTFLSPSPEYLKTVTLTSQKSRFSLTNIFKNNNSNDSDNSADNEYLFLDDFDMKDDKKDSIAEPLYSLIGEIFELHGVFKWLRKTLIIFVQVSFGSTINRQLHETISWLFSESMVLYYMETFKNSMWPDGKMAPAWPERTRQEKREAQMLAKSKFLNSIPSFLVNLVGQQNSRQGAVKVFEALQDKQLNKQLLYNIMEDFIQEFAPELNQQC